MAKRRPSGHTEDIRVRLCPALYRQIARLAKARHEGNVSRTVRDLLREALDRQ